MKMLLFGLLRAAGRLVSPFAGLHARKSIAWAMDAVHTGAMAGRFAALGKDVRVRRDMELVGCRHIEIGEGTVFRRDCILQAWDEFAGEKHSPRIVIGRGCHFGDENHVTAIGEITIGSGLLTGARVLITDNNHGGRSAEDVAIPAYYRKLTGKGGIRIGKNVWIGDGAVILGGVTIGDGAVIGANAVVTRDVPAGFAMVGNPAKTI